MTALSLIGSSLDLSEAGALNLAALAAALAQNGTLTALELGVRRSIAPAQLLLIADALRSNTTLTTLGFREMRKHRGAAAVHEVWGCGLQRIRAHLSRNRILKQLPPLLLRREGEGEIACDCSVGGSLGIEYDTCGQGLRELTCAILRRRLPPSTPPAPRPLPLQLVALDLSGHSIGDDGAMTVVECLCPSGAETSRSSRGGRKRRRHCSCCGSSKCVKDDTDVIIQFDT